MRFRTRWLVWFCLSLMLWAAVLESTHTHANQTEAASCSICIVAHSAAPAVSCIHLKPVFATIGFLSEKEVTANPLLGIFELGIRGPPEL
ncbi:MAG: hypothetical protein WA824_00605 [Candidatus Sulfotelmatobacter sp.]